MIDTSHIKTLEGFWKTAYLYRNQRFEPHTGVYFRRIFDKERVWIETTEWLRKNFNASRNKVFYLLRLAVLVRREHDYQLAKDFDPWNQMRYAEFKEWLEQFLNHSLNDADRTKELVDEKDQKTRFNGTESYFIDVNIINKSHEGFNDVLFNDMPYKDYLACFDLNCAANKYPDFIKNRQVDFVYFLSEIGLAPADMHKIALKNFGIKNFKQQVYNMVRRKPVFVNQVNNILKKRVPSTY